MLRHLQAPARPQCRPPLDPDFLPAATWNRAFAEAVAERGDGEPLVVTVERNNGSRSRVERVVFPHRGEFRAANERYVERLVKTLLWLFGGRRVTLGGDGELGAAVAEAYRTGGRRAFDDELLGHKVYGGPLEFTRCRADEAPAANEGAVRLGRHLDGCRIGFDLGGSDRKASVVVDGEVVFSEEIGWDPYFQPDPAYHFAGIRDSLNRAAARVPSGRRVQAIGGSAAGVYVDNLVRTASLFRGVEKACGGRLPDEVVGFFRRLGDEYGVPLVVVNDGEVTALAGAMAMGDDAVLGLSMGTSFAAGYVTPAGTITDWLNELAFVPVDYREGGPVDEWSGDEGCGVQYFSQQAVARLAPAAGFDFDAGVPFPERLVAVQRAMAEGHDGARRLYETVGICFGYAVAGFAEFYELRNLLVLGRVTSGSGGDLVLERARDVLRTDFPELHGTVAFRTPDEQGKRHGQAVAAASLPELAG